MSLRVGMELGAKNAVDGSLALDVLPDVVKESYSRKDGLVSRHLAFRDQIFTQSGERPLEGSSDFGAWWDAFLDGRVSPPSTQREISAVDVFSGSGGFSVGLRSAVEGLGGRLRVRAAVDIDGPALQVHKHNHGTELLLNQSADLLVDWQLKGGRAASRFKYEPEVVNDQLAHLRGEVDVLIGGPPCQGHSSLNNSTRHNDQRNGLYLTMPALAVALDIPVVVIENVPGVVRDSSGVVQASETLLRDAGYHVTSGVLAADQLGWAQTRKRFFLVGVKNNHPVPLALQGAALRRDALSLRWALTNLKSRGDDPLLDGLPAFSQENMERMSYLTSSEDSHDLPLEIRPKSHRNGTSYMSVYGRMHWDLPAPTITTGFSTPGRGRFTHPEETRTLTAREAARLQAFPNSYFSSELVRLMRPTRSQLTKWIGDAVPAPLGHAAFLSALASYMHRK